VHKGVVGDWNDESCESVCVVGGRIVVDRVLVLRGNADFASVDSVTLIELGPLCCAVRLAASKSSFWVIDAVSADGKVGVGRESRDCDAIDVIVSHFEEHPVRERRNATDSADCSSSSSLEHSLSSVS